MLSCLAGSHLLPFQCHCLRGHEEGSNYAAGAGLVGRIYPLPKPRPSANPALVGEEQQHEGQHQSDLRALGNNPYVYPRPPERVCSFGLKGHSAESRPSFKELLRQLEEEHDRSVDAAQEFLLSENVRLREENGQLRFQLQRLEQEIGRSDGEASSGGGGHQFHALMRSESRVRARESKASGSSNGPKGRSVSLSSAGEVQQLGEVSNAFSVVANSNFGDGDSVGPGQSQGLSRLRGRRPSGDVSRAMSPSGGGGGSGLSSPGVGGSFMKKTTVANLDTLGRNDLPILGSTMPEKCMLSPVSRFRLSWDFAAFSALLADLWCTPIELVFMSANIVPRGFSIMSWAVTCFFVFDIILNFNTGFIERDKLVLKRKDSMVKYLKGWFWVDVLSTLPLDIIISLTLSRFNGEVLSMAHVARLTKVTKVLKTLRFLKMLRAIRLVQQMGRADEFLEVYQIVKYCIRLIQLLTSFAFMAHLHGCVYALLQPDMVNQPDLDVAVHNYYQSFRWAYNAITVGDMTHSVEKSTGVWTLEMIIASERILIAMIVGSWGIAKALTIFQEDAQLTLVKNAAVGFFRQHSVSIETQISVMYSLHETRAAQKMQRHFKSLMSEHLPDELRRTVSEELWVPHLVTLGLIGQISTWHEDFVVELALLVREEVVASKTILCKEGHASIAAYHILKGRLKVGPHNHGPTRDRQYHMPDFTDGMWVEEHALISPVRRRTNTIFTPVLTRLMAVPTQHFHQLISTLGLEQKMQEFRETHLSRGLCGRCGDVGDHFTHACPLGCPAKKKSTTSRNSERTRRKLTWQSEAEASWSLTAFLHAHRLSQLGPLLRENNVESQADLAELDYEQLGGCVPENDDLRRDLSFLHALVLEQQEQAAFELSDDLTSAQHLAFLSHYKMESGTEAALMRNEIERVLGEDSQNQAHDFSVPIFLDSEDLSDLEELQEHVKNSHNLVLLLTKDVLLRPWVLVEIVTAVDHDVRVLPVLVNRKGVEFSFPDEDFYLKLQAGKILDFDGQALLRERDIELRDVERSLREVFNKIALPYSPHRSEGIRMAEVRAIFKQLTLRRLRAPERSDQRLSARASRVKSKSAHQPLEDSAALQKKPKTTLRRAPRLRRAAGRRTAPVEVHREVHTCPICREEYSAGRLPLVHAPCGHVACAACSLVWQRQSAARTCALCRAPVISTAHCVQLEQFLVTKQDSPADEGVRAELRQGLQELSQGDLNFLPGGYRMHLVRSTVQRAVRKGDLDMLRTCLQRLGARASTSMLCEVTSFWHEDPRPALALLCASGARLDGHPKKRPLLFAVYHGNSPMVEALLDKKADPRCSSSGESALHVAVRRRRLDAVGLLLKHGADKEAKDTAGRTPQSLALTGCRMHTLACAEAPCIHCAERRLICCLLALSPPTQLQTCPGEKVRQQCTEAEEEEEESEDSCSDWSASDSEVSDVADWKSEENEEKE